MAVYGLCVVGLVAAMLLLSHILGQRRRDRAADAPYESGIVSTGTPPLRFVAKFYLPALLFVIFDLEIAFLIAWAVVARELGWPGYAAAATFIGVLGVALAYVWRAGALDWGRTASQGRADR
jgi:NADH-quinone oxidoreductase subunit A